VSHQPKYVCTTWARGDSADQACQSRAVSGVGYTCRSWESDTRWSSGKARCAVARRCAMAWMSAASLGSGHRQRSQNCGKMHGVQSAAEGSESGFGFCGAHIFSLSPALKLKVARDGFLASDGLISSRLFRGHLNISNFPQQFCKNPGEPARPCSIQ
jgi:hypothetical protein